MTGAPPEPPPDYREIVAENERLRQQIARMLRIESDLFRRNELLDAQSRIYRALAELGQRYNSGLGAYEVGAEAVRFVLYALDLERCVVQLHDGDVSRTLAFDGYYDDSEARAIAALSFPRGHPLFYGVVSDQPYRLRTLPSEPAERDEVGRVFGLDEYALLPLTRDGSVRLVGYLVAGSTAEKARHHPRLIPDTPLVIALHNLVDLVSAALRNIRLTEALQRERDHLEARVQERTAELAELNDRLVVELRERQAAEQARAALQDEIIRAQERRLEELAAPVLPIAEQILVIPLIGGVDARRGAQVQSAALAAAATHRARVVLIDVTGVQAIDEAFAHALVRVAGALRLLGAHAIVTGIRPDVARWLATDAAALATLETAATLGDGFARALARTRS